MSEQRRKAEDLVAGMAVAAAADASLRRFGVLEHEVQRRASVRAVNRAACALSQALIRFADGVKAHNDGVHCCADMNQEVAALNEALSDFVFATTQAGENATHPGDVELRIDAIHDDFVLKSRYSGWLAATPEPLPPIVHARSGDQ